MQFCFWKMRRIDLGADMQVRFEVERDAIINFWGRPRKSTLVLTALNSDRDWNSYSCDRESKSVSRSVMVW